LEKALYISRNEHFNHWNSSFNRVYFGTEFCERLIPSQAELSKAINFSEEKNIPISLMSAYVSEEYFQKQLSIVEYFSEKKPGAEIIINDWGVFRIAVKNGLKPVIGRILNRHIRDPKIANLVKKASQNQIEFWQNSYANAKAFQAFLAKNNVNRVELDNILQGNKTDLKKGNLKGSLYYPHVFISTTRLCLTANCDKIGKSEQIAILPCNKECLKYEFELSTEQFPAKQYLRGNTVYYRNEKIPENLEASGVDRLVFTPEAPQ